MTMSCVWSLYSYCPKYNGAFKLNASRLLCRSWPFSLVCLVYLLMTDKHWSCVFISLVAVTMTVRLRH